MDSGATDFQSTVVRPDAVKKRVWYCAIGSMMNGTGLRMRGVYPTQSVWCEILDYRRVFYAPSGMATLWPEPGAIAHAVAHCITQEEHDHLEAREPPSIEVKACLRSGSSQGELVTGFSSVARSLFLEGIRWQDDYIAETGGTFHSVVQEAANARGQIAAASTAGITIISYSVDDFVADEPILIDGTLAGVPLSVKPVCPVPGTPQERYLQIMVEGAREAGMARELVDQLLALQCVPRKAIQDMNTVERNEGAVASFSSAEVLGGVNIVAFRGMVFKGLVPIGGSGKSRFPPEGTADIAVFFANQLYDPLYGLPPDHPSKPWAGWPFIEDICANFLGANGYRHVGWLEDSQTGVTSASSGSLKSKL